MFASANLLKTASRRVLSCGPSRNVVTVTGVMGREIIDSRGNPTVEVDIHTTAGRFRGTNIHHSRSFAALAFVVIHLT